MKPVVALVLLLALIAPFAEAGTFKNGGLYGYTWEPMECRRPVEFGYSPPERAAYRVSLKIYMDCIRAEAAVDLERAAKATQDRIATEEMQTGILGQ